jgi:N-acyl homoserine lactone hydrolase
MYKEAIFSSKGRTVTVTPISTGSVSMKTRAHTIRRHPLPLRLLDVVRDKEFTPFLPVFSWLIRHPEGLFLVDTGYHAGVNSPGYFRKAAAMERWFMSTQVRVKMRPEDELVSQLRSMGVSPREIRTVILTHLHVDHVGGIPAFEGASFIVDETEYRDNSQAFLLPAWFDPIRTQHRHQGPGTFRQSHALSERGDLFLVPTPGHTKGHSSVLLQTDDVDLLFAGDVVYSIDQLETGRFAAPNDVRSSRGSFDAIRAYARQRPLVVLPSHDPEAPRRLQERITFRP